MLSAVEKEKLRKEVDETWKIATSPKTKTECMVEMLINYMTEDDFQEYGPLYRHATEDMRTYYKAFNSVEDFLTIGASGDQILNAVSMGAKRIDVFDKNSLSKRGCALKVAAAKKVDKEKLLDYFRNLSASTYRKIMPALKESDAAYWNAVYDILDEDEIARNLFPYRGLTRLQEMSINPYLDGYAYEKLKDQLKDVEINYIDSSLESLHKHIEGRKYNGINLSNVYEYLNYGYDTNYENAKLFHDYIMESIYPHLKDDGKIMVAYMYAFNENVRKFIMDAYREQDENIIRTRAINLSQIEKYLSGLTFQNLSYGLLMEVFKNDPIECVETDHIVYGQSLEMDHDMALMIKR